MIKFAGQFHSFRKTTFGDNLITFCVDRAYSKDISEFVEKDIGTEFIIHLEDVTSETNINKTPIEINEKFVKKLHALLGLLAEVKDIKPNLVKEHLKKHLRKIGLIKESTKELDIKGQAIACNIVEKWINEEKSGKHKQ